MGNGASPLGRSLLPSSLRIYYADLAASKNAVRFRLPVQRRYLVRHYISHRRMMTRIAGPQTGYNLGMARSKSTLSKIFGV